MKVFLLVSALLLLSALAVKGTPVYDIHGEPLKRHTAYYITAVGGAGGGGLYPHECHPTCPPYVAQHSSDSNLGSPVAFDPVNAGSEVVPLTTDTSIQFLLIGTNIRVWRLRDANKQNGRHDVTLTDVAENPDSYFKIVKSNEFFYSLMYCPSLSSSICGHLGIYHENGQRLLRLSDTPFQVVFVKEGQHGPARPFHDSV